MAAPPNNLPFLLTSFVGREGDVAAVRQRLAASRLLTLVGTGGVGKTRLALEAAAGALDAVPDGAWLVELAALTEPGLVAQAVASLLGVSEQPGRPLLATLSEACRPRAILLVLDTCEHLVGPCAELAGRLLGASPRLRILATSRSPLGIVGETVWDVRPLGVPDPGVVRKVDRLARSEAVRLFVDRAGGILPGFGLTKQNAPAIAQICHRLDGIPLAIELAAAWVRTLAVEQIAARLDDRFRLLTGGSRTAPPRQQTLRGAIAWSHDLLGPAERTLFARLSVFAGGCTLEAIDAVCAGDGVGERGLLPLLARLVDASLVATEERGGQKRYRLLETLRAYGREHLEIGGEAEATSHRHARHYLALAEAAEPALWGPELATWLERLEAEHEDLRAALRWSVGRGEAEIALRLGAALARFWQVRGHLSEGLHWLEGGLAWTAGVTPATRARALDAAGHLARDRGDHERAVLFYEQTLAHRREMGDEHGIALALNNLGVVAQFWGDYARAGALHEESLGIFRDLGDERGVGLTLLTLGVMAHLRGEIARAAAWCEEALGHFRRLDDRHGVAASLNNLGNLANARGDHAIAEACYAESLDLFRAMGEQREVAACLRNLAGVARDRGDHERATAVCHEGLVLSGEHGDTWGIAAGLGLAARIAAAAGHAERAIRLFGAATTAREEAGREPAVALRGDHEETLAALKTKVGEDRFAASWAAGRAMTASEAVASVRAPETPTAPPVPIAVGSPGALTRREREVAALIRRGLTNRQIAEVLFIAERTVDTHVEHILAKLGVRSRSQVASWAVEHGLASPPAE